MYRAEGKGRVGWNEQGSREGAEEERRSRGRQKEQGMREGKGELK